MCKLDAGEETSATGAFSMTIIIIIIIIMMMMIKLLYASYPEPPSPAPVYASGDAMLLYGFVCLLVGCLTSQQQASVSQGRICSDNFTCCHTEIEVADPTFYLTQSQYTDTGLTSPSADPITPGAWQGSHWSANF